MHGGHNAFKTASLCDPNGVHVIPRGEQRRTDNVTGFDFLGKLAEFADPFDGGAVEFLDMAEQRLGHALILLVIEPELDRVVAVFAGLRLDLQHAVRSGKHHRDRYQNALGVIDARVTEFLS